MLLSPSAPPLAFAVATSVASFPLHSTGHLCRLHSSSLCSLTYHFPAVQTRLE